MIIYKISVSKGEGKNRKHLSFYIQARSTAEALTFARKVFSKCDTRTVQPIQKDKTYSIWS